MNTMKMEKTSMPRIRLIALGCLISLVSFAALPAAQAVTKVGRYAYALENGTIAAYAFDPTTGQLRIIQSVAVSSYSLLTVHPSNKFVYVTTGSNSIAGFKIGTAGLLTPLPGSPFPTASTWQGIFFTPTGKFGYTQSYANSSGEIFSVNTTTGALTSLGTVVLGSGAGDLAITAKGNFIYAANNEGSTISGFAINPTTGALTAVPGSPFAAGPSCATDWVHPSGKFLYGENFDGSISAYSINPTTGTLTQIAGSPFPGPPYAGNSSMRGTPNGHFLYVGPSTGGVGAFSINQTTGALTAVAGSPFAAGSNTFVSIADPSSKFLYAENNGGGEIPLFIFSIDPSTGALTQTGAQGLVGAQALWLGFTTGTAAVKYTPTFAYATNSGSKSISELSIAGGGMTVNSTLTDTNGPQASAATPDNKFFYTGNSNGSISEYKIGSTGALTKIKGSPVTGLSNPVALAIRTVDTNSCSLYNWLYAADPAANDIDVYDRNPTTGVLSNSSVASTNGNGPSAMALDPFGAFTLVANTASNDVYIGAPCVGFISSVATGAGPVAMTIDPSNQFVYVANSGDNTVSAYSLTLASPYLTTISGSPFAAGTAPSAVVAEPYGQYLYVANTGDNTISAYSISALTGQLTPIGPFSTVTGPSALAVSNDGKYLYVTGASAGEVQQFTINSNGTLTNSGGAGLNAAGATSITAIGTYK
jgi:6-phosphogluconolactonase (cycloisomerase 2 family)